MPNAYLVTGPESSGTRLMTAIIMACGAAGSAEHQQPWDTTDFPPAREFGVDIVFRRSIPHGGHIPNLVEILQRMQQAGYTVRMVVMVRDMFACAHSQVRAGHVQDVVAAMANIINAYRLIATTITRVSCPAHFVPYEALILHPEAIPEMVGCLGLTLDRPVSITDENAKYYRTLKEA